MTTTSISVSLRSSTLFYVMYLSKQTSYVCLRIYIDSLINCVVLLTVILRLNLLPYLNYLYEVPYIKFAIVAN